MTKFLLLAALVSASALAQDTSPPPPPPPPEPQPSVVAAPIANAPLDAPLEDRGGRVRWGVSGNLGWHFPQSAFSFGLEGRVGYQVSSIFSAYAIVGFKVALGFAINLNANFKGGGISGTLLTNYYFGALGELLLGNHFFVAAGPVIGGGVFTTGSVGVGADGSTEIRNITSLGAKPGLDLRLGLALGRPARAPSFRRGGFNIGLDMMVLFHPNTVVTTFKVDATTGTVGAGVDAAGPLMVSVVPMLMLGYDGR